MRNYSVYLKNYSCVTALIDIPDTLLINMDRGDRNGLLMLDLSKAFDLINHNLLINKLEIYGLVKTTFGWFNTYLWMRKQAVVVNVKTYNVHFENRTIQSLITIYLE